MTSRIVRALSGMALGAVLGYAIPPLLCYGPLQEFLGAENAVAIGPFVPGVSLRASTIYVSMALGALLCGSLGFGRRAAR